MYKMLRDLISHEKPGDKSYNDLVMTLEQHYSLVQSKCFERFKFYFGLGSCSGLSARGLNMYEQVQANTRT